MNTSIQKDSALWRGIITALQALITFVIGLIITIMNVPGVSDAVITYTQNHIGEVIVAFGIPMVFGTGIVSFLFNLWFRKDVKTV